MQGHTGNAGGGGGMNVKSEIEDGCVDALYNTLSHTPFLLTSV